MNAAGVISAEEKQIVYVAPVEKKLKQAEEEKPKEKEKLEEVEQPEKTAVVATAAIKDATKEIQKFQRTQSVRLKREIAVVPRLELRRSETYRSAGLIDEQHISEFWNRDDEATGSEEDISDADDPVDLLVQSKSLPNSRLNDRIELLQQAEESYYQTDKKVNKGDKNAISETLRQSGKQRLRNALKQNQQRLIDMKIDDEAFATRLENECYTKYGKSGKSFYLSQLASTVRWLSTANSEELLSRFNSSAEATTKTDYSSTSHSKSPSDGMSTQANEENVHTNTDSETPPMVLPSASEASSTLPPIPSFSDFINSQKPNDQFSKSGKRSGNTIEKIIDKRMKR